MDKKNRRIVKDVIAEAKASAHYFHNKAPKRKTAACKEANQELIERTLELIDEFKKAKGPSPLVMYLARLVEETLQEAAVLACG